MLTMHEPLALVEAELTNVLGYQLPPVLERHGGSKKDVAARDDDSARTNMSPEAALRALAALCRGNARIAEATVVEGSLPRVVALVGGARGGAAPSCAPRAAAGASAAP